MNLVLFALRDNLLAASQSVILLSSAFKECSTSGILLLWTNQYNILIGILPVSSLYVKQSTKFKAASSVERFARNPYRCGDNRLLSVK